MKIVIFMVWSYDLSFCDVLIPKLIAKNDVENILIKINMQENGNVSER